MSLINRDEAAGRETERAVGESSEAAGGGAPPEAVPDPELTERPKRRSFTAEYKLKVLKQVDACKEQGEIGALLRREGLYSSHLSSWRRQREQGELGRKRGRKASRPAREGERRTAPPRRARRDRAGQGTQGDRGAGKRLSALGGPARDRECRREHRAMIEATVEELTPIIGTRPGLSGAGGIAGDDLPPPAPTRAKTEEAAVPPGTGAE